MHPYRSHTCGALTSAHAGERVRLSGWVHRKRDHGQLLFVDLRDHYGITQCVIDSDSPMFAAVEAARVESVITVTGQVVRRSAETINAKLPTGEIEVKIAEFVLQSEADILPLQVNSDAEFPEDTRLRYRFLDLRRERIHANIVLRSKVIASLRRRMIDQGFMEFQTPILTSSSPEGARDYLVPSRIHPGKFYALPQAPQQFKQLLMVAGFDRYFQIAPCFRDEDGRADRSPGEFYQLDFEMSFVTQEDVFEAIEPVLLGVFREFAGSRTIHGEVPRIPYAQAISEYGSDKPDLRNPLKMQDVSEPFRGSGFKVFAGMLERDAKARIWAIPAPTGGNRAFCDRMNAWAQEEGQPGLGYIFWREGEDGAAGPIAKNIGPERAEAIRAQLGLKIGDACFFVGGVPGAMYKFAGAARNKVGAELGLTETGIFKFCWIVDFPMYEINEETSQIEFSHNPFSMPQYDHGAFLRLDRARDAETVLGIKAFQYDIVCNGVELSSGAIRNHLPDIMVKAFDLAGYPQSVIEEKFGGMFNAFKFGAPPHGGSAPGIDRIVMLLADEPNIREVVAFPMNQKAEDLLMQAPASVDHARLRELHIKLDLPPTKKPA
jgi:aspartyl-tRNA synthetase